MIGQWTMPGGGLPSGLLTARSAVQTICRRDHVTFMSRASAEQTPGYSAKQGAGNPSRRIRYPPNTSLIFDAKSKSGLLMPCTLCVFKSITTLFHTLNHSG